MANRIDIRDKRKRIEEWLFNIRGNLPQLSQPMGITTSDATFGRQYNSDLETYWEPTHVWSALLTKAESDNNRMDRLWWLGIPTAK